MKNSDLITFIGTIDKSEFESFYRSNSNRVVLSFYHISSYDLNKILDYFNINHKTKEEKDKIISNTLLNKSQEEKDKSTNKRLITRKNWSEEYKQEIRNKISFTKNNKSEEEKQLQIQKFKNTINNKSEEEKTLKRKRNSEATKNYFKNMSLEDKQAFSIKMKEVYANLPDEVKEERKRKIANTYKKNCIKKYGVSNTFKLKEVQDKAKHTILERYGLEYACQLPQCKLVGNDSSVNINFKNKLIENNIYIDDTINREFNLNLFTYDFKIDNTLIELNPSATHNSTWSPFTNQEKDKLYHYKKSKLARENGYRCICIWDWDDSDKIINLLLPRKTIYARKCEVKEVDLNTAREYLNQYHLQGYAKDNIRLGLFYNNKLISIMTFDKPRYNNNYEYELIRYCSSYNIIGGAQKLFKHFLKNYNPKSIISYCDWSKFNGDVYQTLGFIFKSYSIGKHWYNIKTKQHITDNLLRQRGFDQLFNTSFGKGTSNEQLMLDHGFIEIYDCGQAVYEWKNIV